MGVKIHLLKRVAGPDGNWGAGETIEVDQAQAVALADAGACELISGMQPYVSEAEAKALAEAAEAHLKAKKETATEKAAGKKEKATEV